MEFGLTRQLGRSLKHTGCQRGCGGLCVPVRPKHLHRLASAFDDFRRHRAHNNGKASAPLGGSPKITNASKASAGGGKSDKGVPKEFKNTNRYWVPLDAVEAFEKEWRHRELYMQEMDGFRELTVSREDEDYVVSSVWQSIPEWEKWSLCPVARRSHLPGGIYQYVPDKGAGFPDDFVPFKDLQKAVSAKY
ncbi:hypothetical protein BSKO_02964 [Bryopsis sp. KO-2023]|nr:hypothetical protein BSKO_02964 [Bryopsis sp. KO-2023]